MAREVRPLPEEEPCVSYEEYGQLAIDAARKYGINPGIFIRQIGQESGWNPSAVSAAGARGIAQFMPATAQSLGINPDDPQQAIDAAAQVMRQGLDRYQGSYPLALAAYNAGAGAVDQYGGVPPYPETQQYVSSILGESGQGNPQMPGTIDEGQLGPLIEAAGYKLVGTNKGRTAIWQPGTWGGNNNDTFTPSKNPAVSQEQIANTLFPTSSPYLKAPNTSTATDKSGQIGLNPASGKYEYFIYGPDGKPQFNGVQSPPINSNPGNSTTHSYSFSDPAALQLEGQRVQNEITKTQADITDAIQKGDTQRAQYAQTRLDDLYKYGQTLQYNYATLTQQASEGAANRNATATNQQNQNAFNASQTQGQNAFTANQSQNQNAFTAGQSLLSRAQQAGEFAATYAIQRQQAIQAQQAQQLQAAKTFADLSAAPDLTGFQRFQQAGGGVLGNAIASGATSLTPQGQLGAGRALQAARAPMADIPQYQNPYGNVDLTQMYPAGASPAAAPIPSNVAIPGLNQQIIAQPAQGVPAAQPALYKGPVQGQDLTANPNAPWQTAPGTSYRPTIYGGASATPQLGSNQYDVRPGVSAAPGVSGEWGQAAQPANAQPGYAYGTGSAPIVREAVTAMPSGGSIDTLTDRFALGSRPLLHGHSLRMPTPLGRPRYATGTFILGDSTDPEDPAAGGAHPEAIHLEDPPGDNNARAEVEPLVPPGVGPTEGEEGEDPDRIAALLRAIADFLDPDMDGEEGTDSTQSPSMLGMMGKKLGRFAGGTDETGLLDPASTSPADQQSVDEVLATRRATPYSVNPYDYGYTQQSPTKRAIDAAAFQTATGVPGSELAFENSKYQPGGMSRGSTYAKEMDLTI